MNSYGDESGLMIAPRPICRESRDYICGISSMRRRRWGRVHSSWSHTPPFGCPMQRGALRCRLSEIGSGRWVKAQVSSGLTPDDRWLLRSAPAKRSVQSHPTFFRILTTLLDGEGHHRHFSCGQNRSTASCVMSCSIASCSLASMRLDELL